MCDLISRKVLLETLEEFGFKQETMIPTISLMKVLEIIENQPIAYNVDKVVEQLETLLHDNFKKHCEEYVECDYNHDFCPDCVIKRAVQVVKGATRYCL